MFALIDNRDSFTYNLALAVAELGCEVEVLRADQVDWRDVAALAPERILLGPGPGTPDRAGCTLDVIRELGTTVPILGVCLGHQALGVAFGGRVVRAAELLHGRAVAVHHGGDGLFEGLPNPSWFTLYNSLVLEEATLPECLAVVARTENGEIMAVEHRELPLAGVQFHPESILSENGLELLAHFCTP